MNDPTGKRVPTGLDCVDVRSESAAAADARERRSRSRRQERLDGHEGCTARGHGLDLTDMSGDHLTLKSKADHSVAYRPDV
ncbi:hypothetical protein [Neorhizobium galegae]|uniref:hypothetical protein n=1 Tax=Neorhizobium galegae TaxID=399 RepID=UPI0012D48603|nr:hypothetical protein [Neorhizobium galegae]MCQ1854937.1 hypothetical protein [Neorhizobium galegae]